MVEHSNRQSAEVIGSFPLETQESFYPSRLCKTFIIYFMKNPAKLHLSQIKVQIYNYIACHLFCDECGKDSYLCDVNADRLC